MLKIIGKNEIAQNLVELFSDQFLDDFIDYVENHRVIKSGRYPTPQKVKNFTFWYDFFEERNLIVIKAFKTKNSSEIFHFESSDEFIVRTMYNKFMDEDLYID